ncbi:MAG TPA: alpha/beta hydrolase [Patescibacteria group bacterium]
MEKTLIILHGWGLQGSKYDTLKNIFQKKGFRVYTPDFPGFGNQPIKKPGMTMDDYVIFLKDFYTSQNIKKAYVIGHSFGGRVAAKFATKYPTLIEKIVFTGSPLIKQKLSFKKRVVQSVVKKGKFLFDFTPSFLKDSMRWGIYRFIGEWDYYKAKNLREIFKKVISEDASVYLDQIKNPVLVLWGKLDTVVPSKIGKMIAKKIPNAKYEEIADAGHAVIYRNSQSFAKKTLSFFNT